MNYLLDTGPLLAYIYQLDQHHSWAKAQFADFVDARLPYMADITHSNLDFNRAITLNSDFTIYHNQTGKPISLICP